MASFSSLPILKPRQNLKAEPVKQDDEALARKDTAITSAAREFKTYKTEVKVFMLSTGDDAGGSSEIEGHIRFFKVDGGVDMKENRIDLADERGWAELHGGRGVQFLHHIRETVGFPASFGVWLKETDTFGDDVIENAVWEYTDPKNVGSMDGTVWSWVFNAPFDRRYMGSVTFQVTETTVTV